jgi:hypothetical protein
MKLSKEYQKLLIEELKKVQESCNDAKTLEDKMYYFSASFGVVNRIMNFYGDPTLIFVQHSLQLVHKSMTERLAAVVNPSIISNSVPSEMLDALFKYYGQLISEIEKNDDNAIRVILEKFANLTYATTGNGFYMYLQGKIKL